jgi:hypothetical protein
MESVVKGEPKPVIVQIRYSVLDTLRKSTIISRQNLDTYRSELFNPTRLSLHEKLFRLITIPSLQALYEKPSGQYLRVLVYTSAGLPSPFLRNLHLLVGELGCGEVIEVEENEVFRYIDAIPRVLCNIVDMLGNQQRLLSFAAVRLDDDDGLAANYIDRLSQFISESYSGFAVTFGRGYVGQFDNQSQRFVSIRDVYQPMSSRGLSAICTYDMAKKSFSSPCSSAFSLGRHTTVDRRFPVIIDAREPAFFGSEHTQQDTQRFTFWRKMKQLARQVPLGNHRVEENDIEKIRVNDSFAQKFAYVPLLD